MMFENAGLTRKNEDFMYQLNKQLDAQGATAEAKTALLEETMTALLEGQRRGKPRRDCLERPPSTPMNFCTRRRRQPNNNKPRPS